MVAEIALPDKVVGLVNLARAGAVVVAVGAQIGRGTERVAPYCIVCGVDNAVVVVVADRSAAGRCDRSRFVSCVLNTGRP
jgi:hypothetical protein